MCRSCRPCCSALGVLLQALLLQLEPPNLQRLGGLQKWWLWPLIYGEAPRVFQSLAQVVQVSLDTIDVHKIYGTDGL